MNEWMFNVHPHADWFADDIYARDCFFRWILNLNSGILMNKQNGI